MKSYAGIIGFLLLSLKISAQEPLLPFPKPITNEISNDTIPKSLVDVHLSLGTKVMVSNQNTSSLFWISPDISYQILPKTLVRAGFTYGTDLFGPSKYFPQTIPKSLAPLKPPKKDFINVYGRVEFMPNDKLWVATTFSYQNGLLSNFYYPSSFSGMNVDAFSVNTEMQYQIGERSFLYLNTGFSRINYSENILTSPFNL